MCRYQFRAFRKSRLVLYQMYGEKTGKASKQKYFLSTTEMHSGAVPGQNCYVSSKTAKEIVVKHHFAFPVCFHIQVHCIYLGRLYTLDVSSGLPEQYVSIQLEHELVSYSLALATALSGLPVNYHHQPPLGVPRVLCRLPSGDLHPALLLHRCPLLPVLQELLEPSSQKSPPDKIDLVQIIFSENYE